MKKYILLSIISLLTLTPKTSAMDDNMIQKAESIPELLRFGLNIEKLSDDLLPKAKEIETELRTAIEGAGSLSDILYSDSFDKTRKKANDFIAKHNLK